MFVEHNREGVLALEHSIIGKKKKHNLHVSISKCLRSVNNTIVYTETEYRVS